MAKSFRGKEVDMIALEKKNEFKVALGNAHMNTRGDILGRGGIIVKTREDQLKEWSNKIVEETTIVEKNDNTEVEEVVKQSQKAPQKQPQKKSKKETSTIIYDDITEEEKKQIESWGK